MEALGIRVVVLLGIVELRVFAFEDLLGSFWRSLSSHGLHAFVDMQGHLR